MYRLRITDDSEIDKDGNILMEDHVKEKFLFGVRIFKKTYLANTKRVDNRTSSGFR